MDTEKNIDPESGENAVPANPGAEEKARVPDPDRTDPVDLPTTGEQIDAPVQETPFAGEHRIGEDHAEPTDVTNASNDNYIDGEYIDVGGGD